MRNPIKESPTYHRTEKARELKSENSEVKQESKWQNDTAHTHTYKHTPIKKKTKAKKLCIWKAVGM